MTDRPSQPFPIQTCELQSQFCHMRLVFYIKDLPNELRPYHSSPLSFPLLLFFLLLLSSLSLFTFLTSKRYLAIFQELLFETDLQLSPDTHIRYTDAVKQMSDEVLSSSISPSPFPFPSSPSPFSSPFSSPSPLLTLLNS